MKIAIIGVRGVPAAYGGLEECAEEVGARLAERGHEVTAYCRPGFADDEVTTYRGMRRVVLPALKGKNTSTYSHSLLSMLHVLRRKPDLIFAFNPGIASLCIIPKAFGIRVALNPDGFDWRRDKWGPIARRFIHVSAWMCSRVTDQLIMDAVSVCEHYNETFKCEPPAIYIPNGTDIEPAGSSSSTDEETERVLRLYGVEKRKYILFLSRIEPENSCEQILEGFSRLDTDIKLLFGGNAAYTSPFTEGLKRFEGENVTFPGGIYDRDHVRILHHNCYFVVHGNQAGGTSLGLLKALGHGACVVTPNTADNAYAVADAGVVYEVNVDDVQSAMQRLIDDPALVQKMRDRAIERAIEEYQWDKIADAYEATFVEASARPRRRWRLRKGTDVP